MRVSMLVLLLLAAICSAAPEPAVVQGAGEWTVEIAFEHPRPASFRGPDGIPVRCWYMVATLTNRTGRDVDFYPSCELFTDTLETVPAGKSIPVGVFEHIKLTHQAAYSFLENIDRVETRLLQGSDNALDVAIIWPDFDPCARVVRVYISGLSNESAVINHPVKRDQDGRPVRVFLRKTLELTYSLRGDTRLRDDLVMTFQSKRWVMR